MQLIFVCLSQEKCGKRKWNQDQSFLYLLANRNLRVSINPGIKNIKNVYRAFVMAYGLEEKFLKR
jgi:hypothetical protein